MKSLFKIKTMLTACLFIVAQSTLIAQSISGTTTICPGSGPVRYTFNPSTCTSVTWGNVQGGPVTIVSGGGNSKFIELQFPTVVADVTYVLNAGYNCGGSTQGNATLSVLVKKGPATENRSKSIACSFTGELKFDVDMPSGTMSSIQWSTNTGWQASNEWTDWGDGTQNTLDISHKNYVVNNMNTGYVKAVVLGKTCNNAPIYEFNYTITRTSDLSALAFSSGSVTGICGAASGTAAVSPPAQTPSGYRWYTIPANALKINGGFYSSASAPLTTATPSVTIQGASTQDATVTLYVSAVYPGGCSTAWASSQIKVASGILPAPTVIDDLVSAPGDPTIYLFTAPQYSGATYNWYVGSTLIQSTTNYTFRRYVPCRASTTISCTVTNSCGTSAKSDGVTVIGGCRDTRATNFTVSPNPASSIVTIGVKNNTNVKSSATPSVASFSEVIIYDFSGNPVKHQKYADVKQGTINIGNLRTGTYYIEIKNGRIAEKQTLIIQQ
jgi:hypothetical protein